MHSFTHSLTHLRLPPAIHPFCHSFMYSFLPPFLSSFLPASPPINSLIPSFTRFRALGRCVEGPSILLLRVDRQQADRRETNHKVRQVGVQQQRHRKQDAVGGGSPTHNLIRRLQKLVGQFNRWVYSTADTIRNFIPFRLIQSLES